MKIFSSFILLSVLVVNGYGQELPRDFKTIEINKKIKEFPDQFDLSTPLNSFITFNYVDITGKNRLLRQVSTVINSGYLPDTSAQDSKVSDEYRNRILNRTINKIIIYKDSAACVISEIRDSNYSVRLLILENGNWVSLGENGARSVYESDKFFRQHATEFLYALPTFIAIKKIPTDSASFVNYLARQDGNPKEFVLDKLKKYSLTVYGEVHRRKVSWDFLQSVVNDNRFAATTGVVFMEMASHKQKDIDNFLAMDTIDKELLLSVFREFIDFGWNDKGMYDFVVNIWRVNKTLPKGKRIKIVAVDTPRPFSTFFSKNDLIKNDSTYGDRDEFMARMIINYLKNKRDKRNALFIVGRAHVGKTLASAGSILSREMTNRLYTFFTHSALPGNADMHGRIRYGIFDYAFYKNGDRPVAFELNNSPFGNEPFDAENSEGYGTYSDNYDGYIFFGSLDSEPCFEWLLDLYSEEFIREVDRRMHLEGTTLKDDWGLKELSRDAVLEKLLSGCPKTRWEKDIKPLKNGKVVQ